MVKTGLFKAIDSLIPLDEHLATFRGIGYSQTDKKRSQNRALEWKEREESKPKTNKIDYSEEDQVNDEEIPWVSSDEDEEKKEDDDDDDDEKSIYLDETSDEETDDESVHGDEYLQDDVDEEMKDAEVDNTRKGDEEITDTGKADAEKSEEVKDDNKKAELPPSSSSLFVSSGFGNEFLNLSSDKSTVRNLKDTADAEIDV
ncbi:hypothetical protein Tco_0678216 [Tanacetum coccineum]|uniref:Uncharacterized protein n=1 Tax=Tanacetum coccineum TaxID=301880 RepID=A0ABQ4XEZ9_9ASTR